MRKFLMIAAGLCAFGAGLTMGLGGVGGAKQNDGGSEKKNLRWKFLGTLWDDGTPHQFRRIGCI